MNNSTQQSSQIDDEQIEQLGRMYSQYCEMNSQTVFDSESQRFVVESQLNESKQPVNLDFQTEYLKCMGLNANDIEKIALKTKSCYEQSTQHELDSQTDAETILRAYTFDNPYVDQNIASKPLNVEAFLNSREFFVTIKTCTNNEAIRPISVVENKTTRENNRCRTFTLGPLPLEIEDVLKIAINCDETQVWRSYQKIYGQTFKTVMFYGRCKPCGGSVDSQKGRNVKIYEVDDGSGMVIVHFPHCNSNYSALSRGIDHLIEEYALARKEGITFLGASHYGPKTAKCKEMLNNINIIINIIRQNGLIKQEFFTHGCKVCVIGRVFRHTDGTNHVFAYDMIEDANINRDFEIKYKRHLIDVYEMKYLKFKVTGEPLDNK